MGDTDHRGGRQRSFAPHRWHTDRVEEVGLAFIASQRDLRVYLEARHGGRFSFGRTTAGQYFMTHEQAGTTDWTAAIGHWLAGVNR